MKKQKTEEFKKGDYHNKFIQKFCELTSTDEPHIIRQLEKIIPVEIESLKAENEELKEEKTHFKALYENKKECFNEANEAYQKLHAELERLKEEIKIEKEHQENLHDLKQERNSLQQYLKTASENCITEKQFADDYRAVIDQLKQDKAELVGVLESAHEYLLEHIDSQTHDLSAIKQAISKHKEK